MNAQSHLAEKREHLKKVLASKGFRSVPTRSKLLKYMVEAVLDGRDDVNPYHLGVDVLGYAATFDPSVDSALRSQIRHLRSALDKYYRNEGRSDDFWIEVPEGGCVPVIHLREPNGEQGAPARQSADDEDRSETGSFLRSPVNVPVIASLDVSWIPRLNHFLQGSAVEIVRILKSEPEIVGCGPIPISNKEASLVAKKRADVRHLNDQLGVLTEMPHLNGNPVTLQVWETEYAVLDVLTALGKRPIQVSGSALTVCSDTGELVLHRRSGESRDYPHAIHTFGGTYSPLFDGGRLVRTAVRETWEESALPLDAFHIPAMMLIREPEIKFVQLALLGMAVHKEALQQATGNYEGAIIKIGFHELEAALTGDEAWVPAGRANVLAWLALGAPSSDGRSALFNGKTGPQVFNSIVP